MTFGDILAALLATSDYAKETVGKIRETVRRMQELIDGLEKKAGKTGRKIDDMFIPRLERRFGAMGFVFDRSAERALFGNREYPNCYAEIDVFLEDRGRAVAVAVETQPYTDDAGKRGEITANLPDLTEANIDDIMEHIERMKRLRRHFDLTGDHRRLYGAVAAAVFPADILDFAMKQGFYAIVYVEEHIEVREPEGGAKAW
ncbi:MAG: hypothetical protein LBI91_02835 [Spirochaetaceae bacterium]|jgi:hypothetical protein|nr:hypothetical protein [Spirochaetaceae bacterium]